MSLGTLASIAQQINTTANWNDVKTSQYNNVVANVGRPELNITGASTGLDLVLFYIRMSPLFCQTSDPVLISDRVLFLQCGRHAGRFLVSRPTQVEENHAADQNRSVELANSVLQLRSSKLNRLRGSLWVKASAIFLPVVQMNLLRLDVVQRSVLGYMVLADFIMIVSFGIGSLLLVAVLIKYIHSRAVLKSWNVRYGQDSSQTTNPYSGNGSIPSGPRPLAIPRRNIYDSWLAVRFTIAFVALGLFELVVIFFQHRAANTNNKENIPPEPDLSAARAQGDFALFVPGVSASLLIFIVFGTTRTFRDYLWTKFAPKPLQDMVANRKARKRQKSTSEGETMAPPVVLSTIRVGVKRSSPGPVNPAADDFKGVQTLTTINGHEYPTGQHTNFIQSATPSPTASPGPGSEIDLETGHGHGGHGSYGGSGKQHMHLQTATTPFGMVRSTSRTDDDVPILKKEMPTFQRGYR
ncbi:hypothetical protein N0V85_002359 [Neurospora sp. IMI 360204]|nr:hypothetical protein N0V85_002359 [Neurospora sp. IMI 360204]